LLSFGLFHPFSEMFLLFLSIFFYFRFNEKISSSVLSSCLILFYCYPSQIQVIKILSQRPLFCYLSIPYSECFRWFIDRWLSSMNTIFYYAFKAIQGISMNVSYNWFVKFLLDHIALSLILFVYGCLIWCAFFLSANASLI
jgi:hypothetical protein